MRPSRPARSLLWVTSCPRRWSRLQLSTSRLEASPVDSYILPAAMEPTATGGALPVLQTLQNGYILPAAMEPTATKCSTVSRLPATDCYILPAAMEPTATRRCFIYAPRRLRPRRVSQIEFSSKKVEVCETADHPRRSGQFAKVAASTSSAPDVLSVP